MAKREDERTRSCSTDWKASEPTLSERVAAKAHARLDYEMACPYWECAYLNRNAEGGDPNGTCSFGCTDEPVCVTGGPWPELEREAFYEAHYGWADPNTAEEVLTLTEQYEAAVAERDRLRDEMEGHALIDGKVMRIVARIRFDDGEMDLIVAPLLDPQGGRDG